MSILKSAYGTGFLPSDNCRIGFIDYNDLATQSSAIAHTGGIDTILTNDTLGAQTTDVFKPTGVSDIWNSSTNKFDFSELANGDMIDIRFDITVTTSAPNQEINIDLELGQGGFDYKIHFDQAFFKTASAHPVNRFNGIYIGDDNTRLNSGQFIFSSTDNATINVNGFYCKILIRG